MSFHNNIWHENNDDLPIIAGAPNAAGRNIVVILNHNVLSCDIPMKEIRSQLSMSKQVRVENLINSVLIFRLLLAEETKNITKVHTHLN